MMSDVSPTIADMFANASRLHAEHRLEETKTVLRRLLERDGSHPAALNLLGITLGQQGDLFAACTLLERAIAAGGETSVFLRNLCELRRLSDDPVGAVKAGRRATRLAPADRIARLNLAMAEQDALELDAAVANTQLVLTTEPDNASAHFLLAQINLMRGDLCAGWKDYEWRWRIPGAEQPRPPGGVLEWDGKPCDGTLLVIADQGFGDMMQFARFLPWASMQCTALVVCAPRDLRGLLQRLAPKARFTVNPSQVEDVSAFANFSGLPGLAGTTLTTIPSRGGYLASDPERVQRWAARLDQLAPSPARRIGLVWAGRREHRADRQRSMALADCAPLLSLPGITFISLQKGEPVTQIAACFGPAPIVNLGPELEDYDDTAAVLTLIERLVTVDTSVAHLAGALGMPAQVLLPYRPDWRWLLNRTDSPWYESIELIRDPGPGERGRSVESALCRLQASA